MRIHKLLFLVVLFFTFLDSFSSSSIAIYDSLYEIHIPSEQIQIVEDPKQNLKLEEVRNTNFNKFTPLSSHPIDEFKSTCYWIKLDVINHSSKDFKWIFQVPLHTQYIELYFVFKDDQTKKFITGQDLPFDSRDYKIRSLSFNLPSLREESYSIFIKIRNRTHTDLHFIITDQEPYTRVIARGYIFHGIVYGILLLMALYNFILYLSIRSNVYINYVLYVVCSALFISWKDGLGFQYIWSDFPIVNFYHHKVAIYLLVVTFSLYTINFFELRSNSPWVYKLLFILLGIDTVLFLGRIMNEDYFDVLPYDYLITFAFNFSIGVYYLILKEKSARYFILGYSCMLIALLILKLRYLKLMEWSLFVEYSLNYAVVVEAVAMSLAIRDKLFLLRRQKEQAQEQQIKEIHEREQAQVKLIVQMEENEKLKDKVNRELKEKVAERTLELQEKVQELNEANQKLAMYNQKLDEMSRGLDIDNWNLKKDIKIERQSRLNSELVSFQKFSEVYPDEITCLRFLYVRKWGEDGSQYECKKCKNEKSFELKSIKFAKKCTKCNYIETVSANTLFHRVKFDLNKAFYIAYVSSNDSETSLTSLSEEIQLRNSTCWKFYKRTEEKRELYKKAHKFNKNPPWENLILE